MLRWIHIITTRSDKYKQYRDITLRISKSLKRFNEISRLKTYGRFNKFLVRILQKLTSGNMTNSHKTTRHNYLLDSICTGSCCFKDSIIQMFCSDLRCLPEKLACVKGSLFEIVYLIPLSLLRNVYMTYLLLTHFTCSFLLAFLVIYSVKIPTWLFGWLLAWLVGSLVD